MFQQTSTFFRASRALLKSVLLSVLLLLTVVPHDGAPAERELVILHTNDLHSHLLPGRDADSGSGFARLAHLISKERAADPEKTLLLDGGDFSMGTLFHTITREEGLELRLLGMMGYDALTLGNHEFDLRPAGLAAMLDSARLGASRMPRLIASNLVFSKTSPDDDSLERAMQAYPLETHVVLERGGLSVGLFGLMGSDAEQVAPLKKPVTFADARETARRMVALLKQKGADVIVCISHSGIFEDKRFSEDEILAREVPGIDIIVSGHTHTPLEQPIVIGRTIIVQAGSHGSHLGTLKVRHSPGRGLTVTAHELKKITSDMPEDPKIALEVRRYEKLVDSKFLAPRGFRFRQVIAESAYSLQRANREIGLGNLITDAYLYAVGRASAKGATDTTGTKGATDTTDARATESPVLMSMQPLGTIRDNILPGPLHLADVFSILALGLGPDGAPGYPLLSFYLTGEDIKKSLEVLTTVAPMKGTKYILQLSGVRVTYNPYRMLFERVTSVQVKESSGEFRPLDKKRLYRVCSDHYSAMMISVLGKFTHGILDVVPRDRQGEPITDLKRALVDTDPNKPGVQELKSWVALVEYLQSLPDENGNGIPDIPARYARAEGRVIVQPSLNPMRLLSGGGALTWSAFGAMVALLALLAFLARLVVRKLRQRRSQ